MNQKSSLRKTLQFVSQALTANRYQVYSKNGDGTVRVVVSSAKQALAKADELAESGNDIQIKDLAGRIIDTVTIIELAAHE